MKINKPILGRKNARDAFTLVEVLVAFLCGALMIAVMVKGYVMSSRRAAFAAFSQAAEAMAIKQMERVMTASWRPDANLDQLVSSNFPPDVDYLCLPVTQTNLINCTNYTTITTLGTAPYLKMIQVDCVWTFTVQASTNLQQVFTSTVATVRGPSVGQ